MDCECFQKISAEKSTHFALPQFLLSQRWVSPSAIILEAREVFKGMKSETAKRSDDIVIELQQPRTERFTYL